MAKEENQMYRILAQKEGITITAETSNNVTFEEAKKTAIAEVLGGIDKVVNFQPFVVLPISTKERWENHSINFCPRCGTNIQDHELENTDFFDCYECNASIHVHIDYFGKAEVD